MITTVTATNEDRASAGVLQPDGKIIAGGGRFTPSGEDIALVRYHPNGVPDQTFGANGLVVTVVGGYAEVVSLALQPDGKIVALSYMYTTEYEMVLTRYLSDGTADATFGTGGVVISSIGPGRGIAREVLLQPDGKIVAVGSENAPPNHFALARFNADGTVDGGFGVAGEVLDDLPSSSEEPYSAALLPDGRIVAAGFGYPPFAFTLVRYLPDGTRDVTFGTGGVVTTPGPQYGYSVAIAPDGKLVMSGATDNGTGYDFTIVRYEPDGALDPTFGTGGIVYTPVGPKDDFPYAVGVQPSGKIVAVGQLFTGILSASNFGVVRYALDGTLDTTFGTGGITITSFGPFAYSHPDAILLQPDGAIVGVGATSYNGGVDFALARWLGNECGDGTLQAGEQCDDGNTAAGDCCSPTCTFESSGSACASDGDACTNDVCDGAGSCAHAAITCPLCEVCDSGIGCYGAPRAGCLGTAPAGRSSLMLKNKTPDTRDLLRWKWRSGTVAVGDFGDPLADDYALCVYRGPGQDLWLKTVAPAGGTCGSGRPCWKIVPPASAKYTDRELTPNGLASLVLRSNVPGQVQLKLKGKGVQLGLSPLATLAMPVRVQLQREGDACWDVTYPTAKTSTTDTFDARVP